MSELTIERARAALMEHMAECTADSEAHQLVRMLLSDHLPPLDEIAAAAYGRASGGGTLYLLLKDRLTTIRVYFAPPVTQLFSRGTRDVSITVDTRQPRAQRGTWQGGRAWLLHFADGSSLALEGTVENGQPDELEAFGRAVLARATARYT